MSQGANKNPRFKHRIRRHPAETHSAEAQRAAGSKADSTVKSRAVAVVDLGDFSDSTTQPPAPGAHGKNVICRSRQPLRRFAARRLAGQPLVTRMATRLSECEWVDSIVAVGCELPQSVLQIHTPVVRPLSLPSCHLVERLGAVVDRSGADWVAYVPANRPFVDAGLIDSLLSKASRSHDCDYLGYVSQSGDPGYMEHLGLAGEVCHADAIRRLRRNADRLPSCATIAECLDVSPGDYQVTQVPVPKALDCVGLRFAIEDEKDWDDAQLVCESVDEVDAQWQQVASLIQSNDRRRQTQQT